MNNYNSTPLTDAERERLVADAKAAERRGYRAQIELGRILRELRDRRLYREDGLTWEEFVPDKFEYSAEYARRLIKYTDVHDALVDAEIEPLTHESHALVLNKEPTEIWVPVVQRGRALAEAEGTPLFARHLDAAVSEILDEAAQEATPDDAVREVVRSRGGLHVVVTEGDAVEGTPYAPGRIIVPWTDDIELPNPNGGQSTTRANIDEVAEFVSPAVVPDPWETATAWEADAPSAATFFPDRLCAPTETLGDDSRSRCVIVAPGVDLLHPDMPRGVARAVVAAIGEDPHRLYLIRSEYVERAAALDLPENVVVCVAAHDAASAADKATAVSDALTDTRTALILQDVREPVAEDTLRAFDWVLVRGKRTTQAAYDSVFAAHAVVHVGREVKARHRGYPTLPELPVAETPDRRAVPVAAVRDPETGVLRPPLRHAPPTARTAGTLASNPEPDRVDRPT